MFQKKFIQIRFFVSRNEKNQVHDVRDGIPQEIGLVYEKEKGIV